MSVGWLYMDELERSVLPSPGAAADVLGKPNGSAVVEPRPMAPPRSNRLRVLLSASCEALPMVPTAVKIRESSP